MDLKGLKELPLGDMDLKGLNELLLMMMLNVLLVVEFDL
jgi:hypothetical protein